MTYHLIKATPAALLVLALAAVPTTANAQDIIFDSTQGGDFYGNPDIPNNERVISDFEQLQEPTIIYNGDNGANSTLRRADGQGDFFFANILFNGTGGFGGIDQVNGNGDSGHLTNNGSTNTAIFFLNSGEVIGAPDGVSGSMESDDTLPSGAFMQDFSAGDRIDFTAEITTNGNGGAADSTFEIGFLFDGSTVPQTAPAGFFPTTAGTTMVSGSFFVTADASSFNPVSILTNPATGNDQIGIDNIVLTLFEDVAVVGDVVRDGVLDVLDFNAIRDNFFNTGELGALAGEAIGAENGVVDLDDFISFRSAFLAGGGTPQQFAAFGAVPEPTAAVTLVCGLVLGFCRRSRGA